MAQVRITSGQYTGEVGTLTANAEPQPTPYRVDIEGVGIDLLFRADECELQSDPVIPADWTEVTEEGDAIPSYEHNGYRVWVDVADINERCSSDLSRYVVVGWEGEEVLKTDNWSLVLAYMTCQVAY